jgi:hypothetical protein
MHIVNSVIHNSRSDVFSSKTKSPGLLDVQIKVWFTI